MASTTRSPKEQLENVRKAIKLIEDQINPLYEEMRTAWGPVEAARNKYNNLKGKLLPKAREIEGFRELPDGTIKSDLRDLKDEEAALLQAGAHRG
jgi:uncharacterized coiled-coil DUF342 family protein